jgi:hypothetical protein
MAIKSCKVICCDTEDIEHAVSVSAESLYDAIAQSLKIFRTSEWTSHIAANTVITVRIKEAEIEHGLRVCDWLEHSNRSRG